MDEKRKVKRLKDEKELAVTLVYSEKNPFKENNFLSRSIEISVSGTRIQSQIFLPLDAMILIKMTLKTLDDAIACIGKVKWIKMINENKPYEVGVEFLNPSRKIADYISWKQLSGSLVMT